MDAAAAAGLVVVVGLVLGALGGGGAILTVPAMVYLLDVPAIAATAASLVVVGVAAATSAVLHARGGAVRWRTALVFVAGGTLTGFLTGFLGVGGGFVVVPALVLALGLTMPVAVGTSLVIIALNSAVALVARAGTLSMDWSIVLPFTAGAVLASGLGRPIASRVPASVLQGAFAGLLAAVAVAVLVEATGVIG